MFGMSTVTSAQNSRHAPIRIERCAIPRGLATPVWTEFSDFSLPLQSHALTERIPMRAAMTCIAACTASLFFLFANATATDAAME